VSSNGVANLWQIYSWKKAILKMTVTEVASEENYYCVLMTNEKMKYIL